MIFSSLIRRMIPLLFAICLLLTPKVQAVGTWVSLAHSAPTTVQLMLLLTDGTVMASDGGGSTWHRLTPDIHGSYQNGTWSTLAPMHYTRLYFSSAVLRDGRVFVAGGEYGTGTNTAEVYDPTTDVWTLAPAPPSGQSKFYDSVSKILPNGNVLIAPVSPASSGGTIIYNYTNNTWITGPKLFRGSYQDEATWVKLPDNSILTIDPFGTNSERYIPSLNKWVNDANVPVRLYDSYGSELGPAFLLPNGKAIFFGATGHNALYTPSGTTNAGSWSALADTPNTNGTPDAAGCMMVNGKILIAVSPTPVSTNHFPKPTSYYEYDYTTDTYTQTLTPTGGSTRNIATYVTTMLALPDGSVMYSDFISRPYLYRPDSTPLPAGKPIINSLTTNVDGSYHLAGTTFNGISEGASYGDDNQMNGNYPIVRITDISGNVYYCRSYNWSSTGVMTGTNVVTTEFSVPVNVPVGTYSLVVSANGNSSAPVTFNYTPQLVITTQPADQTYPSGTDVIFTVNATGGYGALSYQWQFNGTNLVDDAHIAGSQSTVLFVAGARAADAGGYRVLVSDSTNTLASRTAMLGITIPDDAAPQFTSFTIVAGYPELIMTGHAGGEYSIDMTTNFVDWTELLRFINDSGTYYFTDPQGTNGSQTFYRAKYFP